MNNPEVKTKKDVILIVDDQPSNLKVMASVLSEDYIISIANNGTNALKMLEKGKPDLILLDIMMPLMDGYQVCEKVKENSKLCDIPIIFLTAKSEIADIARGFGCGAVDYITKPFNAEEVKIRVGNHLKLYHYQSQLKKLNHELSLSQEELKKSNSLLEKANTEKDLLFSIISHDIRNPLTAVSGYGEMLLNQIKANDLEGIEDYAKHIIVSAKRIGDLLEQLFSYAQSKNHLLHFEPMQLNLRDVVTEIFLFCNEVAIQKSIHLAHKIPGDMQVFADNYMINTVLRNLIGNALKYSLPEGSITVLARKADNQTIVTVIDEGIGMSSEILENLFLFDKKNGRKGTFGETSTSLGLILCKEFVEKHGGTIWVESTEHKGSAFSIALPDEIDKN